jgi:acetyl esterase/lipase
MFTQQRMGVSVRSRALTLRSRLIVLPLLSRARMDNPRHVRRLKRIDEVMRRVKPLPTTTVEPIRIGDFAAEWIHGAGVGPSRSGKVVLYFHGGGWFFGGLNTHRRMLTRLSTAAGVPVLSVDYRMLPEFSFHTEIADCVSAYRWLLATGVQPDDVTMAGDSAGGHLAFAATISAREQGLPLPGALVALSACLDLDFTNKLAHAAAKRDEVMGARVLSELHRVFLRDLDASDPVVSPVMADLHGFPPVLLMASSSESLLLDSELMARQLAAAEVPHTLVIWERQQHAFPILGNLTPEARAAIGEIAAFVRRPQAAPRL